MSTAPDSPRAGTRLHCPSCGTEVVVVRSPAGRITCCGQDMRDGATPPAGKEN